MSIGAPLGVNITGDSAGAEQALDRVGKKLDQVEQKARRATLATRDLNTEVSKNLRAGATALRGTTAGSGLAAAGTGIASGGVLGGASAVVAGGAVVHQVLDRFAKLSEEGARATLEAAKILSDAAKEAATAREDSAMRGFNQEEAYRKTMASTSLQGVRQAEEMMQAGYSVEDAYGVSQQTVLNERQRAVLDTIRRRGGNVVDATKKMLTNPDAYSINDTAWNNTAANARRDSVSYVANMLTGQSISGNTDTQLAEDDFLRRAEANRRAGGMQNSADFRNAWHGAGDARVDRRMRAAVNPEADANAAAEAKLEAQLQALRELAGSQSSFAKVMADIFSPGGSFETQLARAIAAHTKARYGDQ